MGGIPAKFIMNIKNIIFLILFVLSLEIFSTFPFLIRIIMATTDIQYKIEKVIIVFVLFIIAIIIHLKLKTEDNPIICITKFLFICKILPMNAVRRMNAAIIILVMNRVRKIGASFCQVIRIVLVFHSISFTIFTNHCWKGEAAILIKTEMVLIIIVNVIVFMKVFVVNILISKIPEEMDWMIKYFILFSVIFFLLWFVFFIIEQNASVFISRNTQMVTHEFIIKHMIVEVVRMGIMRFKILDFKIKLQIWLFKG